MALFTTYQQILATPGAWRFSLFGLVARLPISMVGLGLVLLVEAASGSYALAGTVSAAYMVANAATAIPQGRLLDRVGQRTVLTVAVLGFGLSLVALMASVQLEWPVALTYLFAATGGATLPQVGSAVRARWSYVLSRPADVQTAFALEAVVDEVAYIAGPILVTVLVTTVHPIAGLAAAVVACVGGSLAFCSQRSTEPPAHREHHTTGPRAPMPWATVVPLAVVSAALGLLFGAAEVTTVAFAEERHQPAMSGVLLALWAFGSMIAGLVTGAVDWRRGPATRLRWGALAMGLVFVPVTLVDTIPLLCLFLFLAGLAIAPTMVATFSLTEAVVPPSRLTEGMAIMQTGLVAGVAPGASLSGWVVDHHGASAAYLVCLGAGLVAAAAGLALPRGAARTPHPGINDEPGVTTLAP